MNTPTLIANGNICAAYSLLAANTSSRAGDWISLAGYQHATVIAVTGTDVADVTTWTLNQATSAAGAGSKTLGITEYWRKSHTTDLTGGATSISFARVTYSVATSTFVSVSGSVSIIAVEIRPENLDVSGGFKFFSVDHAAGTTTGLVDTLIILSGPRHARELNVSPQA